MSKRVKVISVKLESLTDISPKAYLARSFNGAECILPKSQVFGQDWSSRKSDAYWIAEWILSKKEIQYSSKKEGWWNTDKGEVETFKIKVERHIPEKKEAQEQVINQDLMR